MLPPVAVRVAICALVWKKWKQTVRHPFGPVWGDLTKTAFNHAGRECRAAKKGGETGGGDFQAGLLCPPKNPVSNQCQPCRKRWLHAGEAPAHLSRLFSCTAWQGRRVFSAVQIQGCRKGYKSPSVSASFRSWCMLTLNRVKSSYKMEKG